LLTCYNAPSPLSFNSFSVFHREKKMYKNNKRKVSFGSYEQHSNLCFYISIISLNFCVAPHTPKTSFSPSFLRKKKKVWIVLCHLHKILCVIKWFFIIYFLYHSCRTQKIFSKWFLLRAHLQSRSWHFEEMWNYWKIKITSSGWQKKFYIIFVWRWEYYFFIVFRCRRKI
jgi:hypothetical protein